MPLRFKRYNLENQAFFVTSKIKDNQPYFLDHHLAELFIETLYLCRKKYEFLLLSFVVMPEHFHAIIIPQKGYMISSVMRKIKSLFVKKMREELGWEGTFWQKSFYDFVVYTDKKLIEKFNYILQNPVRRGLVQKVEDYHFSTANKRFENDIEKFFGLPI
ncbi:MAG: transposase [Thermodesulfobacteriota bacterium]